MVKAVRGATSVDNNDHNSMEVAVFALISTITEKNNIAEDSIISIIFSQTKDLNIANPAAALRVSGQFTNIPLFCTQEPDYEKSTDSLLRVMLTFESENRVPAIPVYLGRASQLRTDLNLSD